MRTLMLTAAAAAMLAATPAFAAVSNSGKINLSAVAEPTCTVTSPDRDMVLTTSPSDTTITYNCNFDGDKSIALNDNGQGGVHTGENGGATVTYEGNFGSIVGDSGHLPALAVGATGAAGDGVIPVSLKLSRPLPVAGHYSDTLNFTINP